MLILGIDPGSQTTGYGVVESKAGDLEAVDFGVLSCRAKTPLPNRLAILHDGMSKLMAVHQPSVVALETPFAGINPRSLAVLAQARGALLAAAAADGATIREYAPTQVKAAVTGHGRADKQQVADMVRLLLKLTDKSIKHDASDALAVAICCAHREAYERLSDQLTTVKPKH